MVGFGERGLNPARRQSFVITEALENTISSGRFLCRLDRASATISAARLALKWALIRRVAEMSRCLHTQGINHRDYYSVPFFTACVVHEQFADPVQEPAPIPD